MPWWQKLRTAKEAGYDYLEMSIDESDSRLARLDWNDTDIDALCRTAKGRICQSVPCASPVTANIQWDRLPGPKSQWTS